MRPYEYLRYDRRRNVYIPMPEVIRINRLPAEGLEEQKHLSGLPEIFEGVGKEELIYFETLARKQKRIYPDAADVGIEYSDKLRDEIKANLEELRSFLKSKTTKWGTVESSGGGVEIFFPYERDGGRYHGTKLVVTHNNDVKQKKRYFTIDFTPASQRENPFKESMDEGYQKVGARLQMVGRRALIIGSRDKAGLKRRIEQLLGVHGDLKWNGDRAESSMGKAEILPGEKTERRALRKSVKPRPVPYPSAMEDRIKEFWTLAGVDMREAAGFLDPKLRRKINGALIKAGMDGNGRFKSVNKALVIVGDVLRDHGLEWGEVASAYKFQGAKGSTTMQLAQTNEMDVFSPTDLRNSLLSISWDELRPDSFEVIAYVS